MIFKIPWYMTDTRFKAGTVADVGDIRITIKKTDRKRNNKWRLYMGVRTRKINGVADDLKRDVCVAEFKGSLLLEQVQKCADNYLEYFLKSILGDL